MDKETPIALLFLLLAVFLFAGDPDIFTLAMERTREVLTP